MRTGRSAGGVVSEQTSFLHFDLLSQFVAKALQSLTHGHGRGTGVPSEPLDAPATVIVKLAQAPLFLAQREQCAREPSLLGNGPT